jgi:predicted transcriptional regulator
LSEPVGVDNITAKELLTDLGATQTDLARIIEAVDRDKLPFIVVAAQAVRAWEQREPHTWAKVTRWLAARNVGIVAV